MRKFVCPALRCGEVRLSIVANSEISLGDQLKDLSHRIKVLEKQLLLADELRARLEASLEQEKVPSLSTLIALTGHSLDS